MEKNYGNVNYSKSCEDMRLTYDFGDDASFFIDELQYKI